jgi:NAD(P)-dependent dehydrogenase (short-subunit alcohol dehydrogenase family)
LLTCSHGIGFGLVERLLNSQTSIFVFAGVRDLSNTTALTDLHALHKVFPNKLQIIQFVAADEESNKAAAKVIEDRFGWVDVVIGNAGISHFYASAKDTPASVMIEHLNVRLLFFRRLHGYLPDVDVTRSTPSAS